MSGMIEEVYITYLIDFSKSAQLSTFFGAINLDGVR